jgi:hypothetical protein
MAKVLGHFWTSAFGYLIQPVNLAGDVTSRMTLAVTQEDRTPR